MDKIGIFGGTFNPIHIGHLRPVEEVREFLNLSKVFYIPAKIPPHKSFEDIISAEQRFEIIKLALQDNEYFIPSDIELKWERKSYTVFTLEYFLKTYITNELYLIIGMDSFLDLTNWYEYKKITELVNIAVMKRETDFSGNFEDYISILKYTQESNFIYINEFYKKLIFINTTQFNVSSTEIRKNFKNKKSNKYLIPEPCLEYIKKNKLYQTKKGEK